MPAPLGRPWSYLICLLEIMHRLTASHTTYCWEVAILIGSVGHIDLLALRSYVAVAPFHNLTVGPKLKRARKKLKTQMVQGA